VTTWQIAVLGGGVFAILGVLLHLSRQIDCLTRLLQDHARSRRETLDLMASHQQRAGHDLAAIAAHYRKEAELDRKVRSGSDAPFF